jgi:HD-like signal output (HDOD) protein/CheY-like chemotaxis protein
MKHILFVDDEPHVLDSLRDALRTRRHEWSMAFARGSDAALAELDRHEYDVVVSDMRMPGMDGADLLAKVRDVQPSTVRIVLSGHADLDVLMRATAVSHRFVAKPCDTTELIRVVERSCAIAELAEREDRRRTATRAAELPCIPGIYHELSAMLGAANVSIEEVGALVEQDIAVSARVLQLANSGFFGGTRRMSRITDAVTLLGVGPLKALVLSAGALGAFEPTPPIEGFSLEQIQRRGIAVAAVTRTILPPGVDQDTAVAAAMLRDVGLLVLAVEEPARLAATIATSLREYRSLAAVEYDEIGVSHAEVGAHLLALWGLPHTIVEAVAFHHRPEAAHDPALDPVAAVAIGDSLVRDAEGRAPSLDLAFVERLGVTDRLPEWRAAATAVAPALTLGRSEL